MTRPQHIVVPTEDVLAALAGELAIAREGCGRLDGALVRKSWKTRTPGSAAC